MESPTTYLGFAGEKGKVGRKVPRGSGNAIVWLESLPKHRAILERQHPARVIVAVHGPAFARPGPRLRQPPLRHRALALAGAPACARAASTEKVGAAEVSVGRGEEQPARPRPMVGNFVSWVERSRGSRGGSKRAAPTPPRVAILEGWQAWRRNAAVATRQSLKGKLLQYWLSHSWRRASGSGRGARTVTSTASGGVPRFRRARHAAAELVGRRRQGKQLFGLDVDNMVASLAASGHAAPGREHRRATPSAPHNGLAGALCLLRASGVLRPSVQEVGIAIALGVVAGSICLAFVGTLQCWRVWQVLGQHERSPQLHDGLQLAAYAPSIVEQGAASRETEVHVGLAHHAGQLALHRPRASPYSLARGRLRRDAVPIGACVKILHCTWSRPLA